MEIPAPVILHMESPSPFTPLGAKGVGEGNCMSTPVCLANAVADALGVAEIDLPLTPAKLAAHLYRAEGAPRAKAVSAKLPGARALYGSGTTKVQAAPGEVWRMLLDPDTLAAIVPGAHEVEKISNTQFRAEVTLGVGPVKGRYQASIELSDFDAERAVTLSGSVMGVLGSGRGSGRITLAGEGDGTMISYTYDAEIGGKLAAVGGRLLDSAARLIIRQFFEALARRVGGPSKPDWRARLRSWLRRPA